MHKNTKQCETRQKCKYRITSNLNARGCGYFQQETIPWTAMVKDASACCRRLTVSHVYSPESSGVTSYSIKRLSSTTERSLSMTMSPSFDHVMCMSRVTSPVTSHRSVTLSPRVKFVTSSGVVMATEKLPAAQQRKANVNWKLQQY